MNHSTRVIRPAGAGRRDAHDVRSQARLRKRTGFIASAADELSCATTLPLTRPKGAATSELKLHSPLSRLKGTNIVRCSSRLIPISVVAVAVVSLLAAGCGGGSPRSTTAATTMQTGALAFARCMRSHGLSTWPDPDSSGVFDKSKLRQLGYSEPRVRSIEMSACSHFLPGPQGTAQQQHTRFAAMLSFANCMRARGFQAFPDPTSQGELTPQMVTAAGIDLHQPKLLNAGLACVPLTHGLLTRTAIERAVNGG